MRPSTHAYKRTCLCPNHFDRLTNPTPQPHTHSGGTRRTGTKSRNGPSSRTMLLIRLKISSIPSAASRCVTWTGAPNACTALLGTSPNPIRSQSHTNSPSHHHPTASHPPTHRSLRATTRATSRWCRSASSRTASSRTTAPPCASPRSVGRSVRPSVGPLLSSLTHPPSPHHHPTHTRAGALPLRGRGPAGRQPL